jgi:ligand-binding SRPBCC domain-containing protein
MRFSYHSQQWLPHAPELVFAFLANPENLPRLTPKWQSARIEEATIVPPPRPAPAQTAANGPAPRYASFAAGAGTRLTISFRPFPYCPIRIPWETEITEFVWNARFSDLQVRGPFAYWSHTHSIEPQTRISESGATDRGTLLRDDIDYELPFDRLGRVAQKIFVSRQLRATFEFRRSRIRELLPLIASTSAKLGRF